MAESTHLRWAAPGFVLLLLAGCAAPPPPPPPAPPPGPPKGIEGRYRGTARLIRSNNRYCPRSGPRVHMLENGVVTLAYQGTGRQRVSLTAKIDGNGDFDVGDGEGRLQGHVGNGELVMTVASQYCEHHWTMRQID